jgi:lipopolysaccharide export system protein LptA
MKSFLSSLFLLLVLALGAGLACAEKADRDKSMNVEADALRYDDVKQTSVFSGRVVLTKGTILIRAAKIDVRQDAQGFQFGLISAEPGKLAFFRQKREGLDEYFEGEGELIEYDGRADTARISSKAQLRRYRGAALADEFTGDVIVYNNTTDVFSIDGAQPKAGAAPTSGGRIRAMLIPKPQAQAASAPVAGPSATPALRSSVTLGGEKK